MKKKLALLLATVMTVSAPMTAFAANILYGGNTSEAMTPSGNATTVGNVPDRTLFPQSTIYSGGLTSVNHANSATIKDQNIDYIVEGTDLVINLEEGEYLKNGDVFNISLENAYFWFAEDVSNDGTYISIPGAGETRSTTFNKDRTASFGKTSAYQRSTRPSPGKYAVNQNSSGITHSTVAETNGNIRVYNDLQYNLDWQEIESDLKLQTGTYVNEGNLGYIDNDGKFIEYVAPGDKTAESFIGYRIAVANNTGSGKSTATITMTVNVDGEGRTADNETYALGSETGSDSKSQLRIPLVIKTVNDKDVNAYVNANGIPSLAGKDVSNKKFEISTGVTGRGTNFTISNIYTARETTALASMTLEEANPGTMRSGYFELELSNGFKFNNNILTVVSNMSNWGECEWLGYNADKTVAYFKSTIYNPSVSTRGFFSINGASISRTNDYYNYTEEKASITVRGISNASGNTSSYITYYDKDGNKQTFTPNTNPNITAQTITVAQFANYGLFFGYESKDDKPVVAYAGRANVVTPRLELSERATHSWWSDRTTRFTLTDADGNPLESAKIAKVVVSGFQNVTYPADTYSFSEDSQVGYNPYYVFNRGYLEMKDLKQSSDYKSAKMNIQFVINTAANFVGDVYVTTSGLAIDPEVDIEPVKIMEVKAPVHIKTDSTEVTIGYQTYRAADVTITEDAKGVLRAGKTFALEVDEFANSGHTTNGDVSFNPITSGDITMDKNTTLTFNKITLGGNAITFNISKPSTSDKNPGVFTVSNLNVKINRSVPYGNYDLIAGGTAIAETYDKDANEKTSTFKIKGVVHENYIKVATPGDNKTISKQIVITPGSAEATVDGKIETIDPPAYINDVGRVMIPLRAISTLFEIPEKNIIWDQTTGTATIVLQQTNSERIVTFTAGETNMTINGVPVAMIDENGVATKAEINADTNRMYIPLRQLGIAFGIDVEWDGTNAIFNPSAKPAEALQ